MPKVRTLLVGVSGISHHYHGCIRGKSITVTRLQGRQLKQPLTFCLEEILVRAAPGLTYGRAGLVRNQCHFSLSGWMRDDGEHCALLIQAGVKKVRQEQMLTYDSEETTSEFWKWSCGFPSTTRIRERMVHFMERMTPSELKTWIDAGLPRRRSNRARQSAH